MKKTVIKANGEDTGYGLGLRRLTNDCGIMWGHGGTAPGYDSRTTCASPDGTRSSVAMINVPDPAWPSNVVKPFEHANSAIRCQALRGRAPAAPSLRSPHGNPSCHSSTTGPGSQKLSEKPHTRHSTSTRRTSWNPKTPNPARQGDNSSSDASGRGRLSPHRDPRHSHIERPPVRQYELRSISR